MREDIWRILGLFSLAALCGLLVSKLTLALLLAALGYLAWQERKLVLLLRWVENRKGNEPPESPGVYDAICREIDFMRERHRKRKKKLGGFLKQFQDATAALPDAAVVLGGYYEIQWANAAAEELLGIQWPRDYNQRVGNLLRNPEFASLLFRKDRLEKSVEFISPSRADIYLSVSVVPMGKDQHLLTARNVTRLHRLNQIRSDFVANVSHELRTPVTVIKGYLETINSTPERCPPEWRSVFTELENQAVRMGDIIDELLLLARLERDDVLTESAPIDVPELLNEICAEARALDKQPVHEFKLEIESSLWLLGSRAEIYSAFSNLVVNALRYSPGGSTITLRWYRDAQGARFAVADQGIGIPRAHIPRLTERFYRVDRSRSRESGGTGLGLAIVKHVLKRHHANLHITSTEGKGSTFRCDFPPQMAIDATMNSELETVAQRRR